MSEKLKWAYTDIVKEHLAAGRVAEAIESYGLSSGRYAQLSKIVKDNGYVKTLCLNLINNNGGTGVYSDDDSPILLLSQHKLTLTYQFEKTNYKHFKQRFIQQCDDLSDLGQDVSNEWAKIYAGTAIALVNSKIDPSLDDIVFGVGRFVIPLQDFVTLDFQIVPYEDSFEIVPGDKEVIHLSGDPYLYMKKHYSDYLNLVVIMPLVSKDIDSLICIGCEGYLDMFCDAAENDYRSKGLIDKQFKTLPKV